MTADCSAAAATNVLLAPSDIAAWLAAIDRRAEFALNAIEAVPTKAMTP